MDREKLPPQSLESEMSVLGGILMDNQAVDTVHDLLTIEDFYRESHRLIFSAMADLADKNEPIDLVTLSTALKSKGHLEQVGGGAYLYTLSDYVPTSANIAYYCKIVSGKAAERRVLNHTQTAATMIYQGESLTEVISELEKAIQLPTANKTTEPVSAKDSLRDAVKILEQRYESKGVIQGISYGLGCLDKVTDGLHRGDLIIIAGRPSMGKTTFALNILESVCASGLSGLLFSLEMSRQNNIDKMISSQGKVKYHHIRGGQFDGGDWQRIIKASSRIHDWRLFIDDTPAISLYELRSKARRLKKKQLDVIVVDYLQLMTLPSKDSRVQGLGEVSRGLKQLARELDVAIIALSQLSRSVDSRNDKRPVMSDLRDSGEIEQDADVILFPFRPASYCQQCKDRVDDGNHNYREHGAKAEIIIEKQRNGERNLSIPVVWLGEYQTFLPLGE